MTDKKKPTQDPQDKVKKNDQPATPKLEESRVDPRDEEIKQLKEKLARAMADYVNLENRFNRDSSSVVKFATAGLLTKLLDIRDHLHSASTHFPDKSLTMILSSFDKILAEEGVETVKTDGLYDPSTMECAEAVPGDKDKVISVLRQGYKISDRILRTARVTVGNGQLDRKNK